MFQLNPWELLLLAGSAILCGAVLFSLWYARPAGATASSEKLSTRSMEARLSDCEALVTECVQALSRIEARDKMRQVRAARTAKEELEKMQSQGAGSPDEPPTETARISTAELRRQLAARRLIR